MGVILLDTCVVSELRRRRPDAGVRAAVAALPIASIALSALTIGELVHGISWLPQGQRRVDLKVWLDTLERQYAGQIVSVDRDVAVRWGELGAAARQRGEVLPIVDGLIAATALHHGMTVMTRNIRHFAATGVTIVDPWAP